MYIIAHLYSPATDSVEDMRTRHEQSNNEHEQIMSQFYEQELPDMSKDTEGPSTEGPETDREKAPEETKR